MKTLPLNLRMAVVINGVIVVVLMALIGLEAKRSLAFARTEASAKAEEIARRHAREVQGQFDGVARTVRVVAQTFEGMKASWVDDRSLLNGTLSQILRANPALLTIWSCWEPNQLDGKDADFANKAGYDATGRFVPLWYRNDKEVVLGVLVGYANSGERNYYALTKEAGKETMFEPAAESFAGRKYDAAVVAVPVRYNGEIIAAVGAHVDLAEIAKMVASIHPYDTGYAGLATKTGRIVAHAQSEQIGRSLAADVLNGMKGESGIHPYAKTGYSAALQTETLEIHVPITIGEASDAWVLSVYLPMDRVLAAARRAILTSSLLGLGALLFLNGVVYLFSRSITKPLRSLATEIETATNAVVQTADVLSASSQTLADGASSQASALQEASASLEETASMAKSNADSARKMNELSRETRIAADASMQDAQQMGAAMAGIKTSSDAVSKIIGAIDEIAFQTNILALNAAVEAARAGEAGAGFAVVADEVRRLAQRSASAAKETEDKIQEAIRKTAEGVAISEKVAQSLAEIASKARQVNDLAAEVAQASGEQTEGVAQINNAVGQMDQVTQSNAAGAEQTSSAASELQNKAAVMKHSSTALLALVEGSTEREARRDTPAASAEQDFAAQRRGATHAAKAPDTRSFFSDELSEELKAERHRR